MITKLKQPRLSEQATIDAAIDEFASAMKARMGTKRKAGWHGWDNCSPNIEERLLSNAASATVNRDKKSCIDTANLAMMIWLSTKDNHE